jgi:hypothetical protein
MESRKFGSRLENVTIGRLALVLVALAIVAMAVIELAVALNIEFTQTLVRKAMWAGSLLWMAIAVIGWWNKFKNKNNPPLWCAALFTAIATGSVAGMYTPTLASFALWANATLAVLFVAVIVWVFPQAWKNCAAVPAES